jgi:hypothetical protein
MVKDLIGNTLGKGDKVHVQLPNPQIFGFIAEIVEPSRVSRLNQTEAKPGHILVSCVIAVPIDPALTGVPQLAKVYDSNYEDAVERASKVLSDPASNLTN